MHLSRATTEAKQPAPSEWASLTTVWVLLIATATIIAIVTIAWQPAQETQTKTFSVSHLATTSGDQRQLNAERFLKALEGRPKAPVEIVVSDNDTEALQLALEFQRLLQTAAWNVSDVRKVSQQDLVRLSNQPTYLTSENQLVGVAVAVLAESQEEFDVFGDRQANTPLNALLEGILETLGSANIYASSKDLFPAPPRKTLRLSVGSNPANSASAH